MVSPVGRSSSTFSRPAAAVSAMLIAPSDQPPHDQPDQPDDEPQWAKGPDLPRLGTVHARPVGATPTAAQAQRLERTEPSATSYSSIQSPDLLGALPYRWSGEDR